MAVSYPRGMSPMAPSAPAPVAQPVKAKAAPAGGFAKALTHHGHLGTALKAGNAKKAMHHIGHLMLAVQNAAKAAQPTGAPAAPSPADQIGDGDSMDASGPTATSGTDVGAQSLPSKKPFNRSMFGAMSKKVK